MLNANAARAVPIIEDLANGIGQGGYVFESGGDGFEACCVEAEAVEHRGGKAFFLTRGDIFGVGRKDFHGGVAETLRHREEDGVFRFRGELGKFERGGARLAAHCVDLFGDGIAHGVVSLKLFV